MYSVMCHFSRLQMPRGVDGVAHCYSYAWFQEQQFKSRAIALVDKWTSLLLDDLPNRRLKRTDNVLHYVIPSSITEDSTFMIL